MKNQYFSLYRFTTKEKQSSTFVSSSMKTIFFVDSPEKFKILCKHICLR